MFQARPPIADALSSVLLPPAQRPARPLNHAVGLLSMVLFCQLERALPENFLIFDIIKFFSMHAC